MSTTKQEPVHIISKEITLSDNTQATVIGKTYDKPLFPSGEIIHNLVEIVRKDNNATCGLGFYRDQMSEDELRDKVNEIAENPQTIELKK